MSDTLLLNGDYQPIHGSVVGSLISWKDAIRLHYLDKIIVLDTYKDWHVHSAHITFEVPALAVTKEYFNFEKRIPCSKKNVFLRDLYKCQYCFDIFPGSELTWDHVLPRDHGGTTCWTNVVTSCKECNHTKGNNKDIIPKIMPKTPNYWLLADHNNQINDHIMKHDSWRDYFTGTSKKRA